MKAGFFTMELVHTVMAEKDLFKAKQLALEAIQAMPTATNDNKYKAVAAVNRSSTIVQLGTMMTNFLLAHPSEGLKCIK